MIIQPPSPVREAVRSVTAVRFDGVAAFTSWWSEHGSAGEFFGFQHPSVMEAWERTVGLGSACFVVRVDDEGGRPLLAAFLTIDGRRPRATLRFMDGGMVDYNAPMLFQGDRAIGVSAADLWSKIRSVLPPHDFVVLDKMTATVNGISNPLQWSDGASNQMSGHAMSLPAAWDDIKDRFRDVEKERQMRRLEDRGGVRLLISESADGQERIFSTLLEQKSRRFQQRGQYNIFNTNGVEGFYRALLPLEREGLICLSAMEVGDTLVATNLGITGNKRFIGVLTAFEGGEWAKFSCGALHLPMLIRWSIENGLSYFDFGIGDEPYKMNWCDQHFTLTDIKRSVSLGAHATELISSAHRHLDKLIPKAKVSLAGG